MKRFIFILLVFICVVKGFSQQHTFVTGVYYNSLYSFNLANCSSRLIGKTTYPFIDLALTPDGRLWGINGNLYLIDTTTAAITLIGGSKGTDGACLVALNDSILLGEWYDSLEAINVRTAQSTILGRLDM
jgi:hypothetical protein